MSEDEKYMKIAIDLAKLGCGFTSPNPCVGAVIVRNGRIVGVGYHKRKGEKHAEVRAIEDAGEYARDSTMYVTLEPHSFYGTQPPCTDAIIRAGIKRVIIATLDPNPKVNGKGVEILKNAGLEVKVGVLREEAEFINRFFIHYMKTGRPYVILKLAVTLDGFIADRTGSSHWISGEESRKVVHRMRGEVDAIMIGSGTLEKDDPELLPRKIFAPRKPVRIIVSGGGNINFNRKIFKTPGKKIISIAKDHELDIPPIVQKDVEVIEIDRKNEGINLVQLMEELGRRGIQSVLCEGGGKLAGSLLKEDLVNELLIFYAPFILGSGKKAFEGFSILLRERQDNFELHSSIRLGNDLMIRYLRK